MFGIMVFVFGRPIGPEKNRMGAPAHKELISLSVSDDPILHTLKRIELKSSFHFVFSRKLKKSMVRVCVTINVKKQPIEIVVNAICKGRHIEYRINWKNRTIFLFQSIRKPQSFTLN